MIIWGTLFIFWIKYGESVSRDPCSICAEKMKGDIVCTTTNANRIYYKNGSIVDTIENRIPIKDLNIDFSELDKIIPKED